MPSFSAVKRSSNRQAAKSGSSNSKIHGSSAERLHSSSDDDIAVVAHDENVWAPTVYTAFKLFASLRLSSAMWGSISDCDETYNYWEPLHLMLYGSGFQTWEYSPIYAIRSYAYIWLYAVPIKIYQGLLPTTKMTTFFALRCFLASFCAFVEMFLYKAILAHFSKNVARLFFLFQLISAGMFVSCCAFLPSTFSMVFNMIALTCWLQGHNFLSVLATAISALVGWPFAAVLGLPVLVDMLVRRRLWKQFFTYAAISGIAVCAFLIQTDSYYYGRRTLAPFNIVMYNVLSKQGSILYGVEPLSYYVINGLLNFNVVFPLALLSIPVSAIIYLRSRHVRGIGLSIPALLMQSSMLLWILIFFSQPHKEERFLFPIYPLFCINAALVLDALQYLCNQSFPKLFAKIFQPMGYVLLIGFFALSISRCFALYKNYHAPFTIYLSLAEEANNLQPNNRNSAATVIRVCVGKEWYRYPSSFFLPDDRWQLNFVESEFKGILPKPYETLPIPNCTRLIPTEMNDQNREEPSRYIPVDKCDYLVDFSMGEATSTVEPDYSKNTDQWRTVATETFLNAGQSHRLFRAFYVPGLTETFCRYGQYNLLKNVRK